MHGRNLDYLDIVIIDLTDFLTCLIVCYEEKQFSQLIVAKNNYLLIISVYFTIRISLILSFRSNIMNLSSSSIFGITLTMKNSIMYLTSNNHLHLYHVQTSESRNKIKKVNVLLLKWSRIVNGNFAN